MMKNERFRHNGPYDRGSADAYYNRPRKPHCFDGVHIHSRRIPADEMNAEELADYHAGYDEEDDRKEWD